MTDTWRKQKKVTIRLGTVVEPALDQGATINHYL